MERYSDRAIEIINELHTERLDYESEYLPLIDCANQCASYEDTGMEPEEVRSLRIDMAIIKAMFGDADVKRMKELCEADKERRVVVLPCKVGDAVYSLSWNIKTEQYDVHSREVKNVRYDSADDTVTVSDGEYLRVLGKTVFLTRAEAEAAIGGGGDG